MKIEEIWKRLENWLRSNAPDILEDLRSGATKEQIKELEQFVDTELPEDFKASHLIFNGTYEEGLGLIDGCELLSIERIKEEWQSWKELFDGGDFQDENGHDFQTDADSKISPFFWWNPKWIPITHDGGGNHYCIDLDPTAQGNRGQIITFWHDAPEREVIAPSFKDWLQSFLENLESGKLVYSEEYSCIMNVEEI